MNKEKLRTLSDFMCEHQIGVSEIKEMADYAVIFRNIPLTEIPVPMTYANAYANARQAGKEMMSAAQAQKVYQNFELANQMLEALGEEPIKKYLYWLKDEATKPYLAKVFDFRIGQIKELKKSESFRVRLS